MWIGGGASPDEKKNAMTYAHVSPAILLFITACIPMAPVETIGWLHSACRQEVSV